MKIYTITTSDNIYSPIDQFQEWYAFDIAHSYNSMGKMMRLMGNTLNHASSTIENERQMDAVDFLVENKELLQIPFDRFYYEV